MLAGSRAQRVLIIRESSSASSWKPQSPLSWVRWRSFVPYSLCEQGTQTRAAMRKNQQEQKLGHMPYTPIACNCHTEKGGMLNSCLRISYTRPLPTGVHALRYNAYAYVISQALNPNLDKFNQFDFTRSLYLKYFSLKNETCLNT